MRISICDDDKLVINTIKEYINSYPDNNMKFDITEFSCGEDLIEYYKQDGKSDIIFLDIEMKEKNGIETARELRSINNNAIIFFVTNHENYVYDTFRVGAFQFLKKPLLKDDFYNDFKRAIDTYKNLHYKYEINYKNELTVVDVNEIIFMEVFDHSIIIHCTNKTYRKSGKLKEEIKILNCYGFVQCHKSMIINMLYIRSLTEKDVILKDNTILPLGKTFKKNTFVCFNKYLSERCI